MTVSNVDYLTPALWLGERAERYEFDLLDKDLFVYATVQPTTDANPTITANTDRAIARTLDGVEFMAGQLEQVNPLADRLRPMMILPDGTRCPLGVYLFGEQQNSLFGDTEISNINFTDQAWILDQPLERSASIDPGGSGQALLYQLATEVGIRSVQITLDVPSPTVSDPVAWAAGSSRFTAMDDLAQKMGCLRPYFDNNGTLIVRRAPTALSTIDFAYVPNQMIADSLLVTDDSYRAPNRYIAIGTGQTTPIVGTYDVPDTAPHSFAHRGFVVAQTIDAPGVADTFGANEAARAAAIADSRSYSKVSFSTPMDCRHDLYSIIQFADGVWMEVEQRLQLSAGGNHDHVLARLW